MDSYNHVSDNLKKYFENNFKSSIKNSVTSNVVDFVDTFWEDHLSNDLKGKDAIDFLRLCFPQLNFSIEKNIEETQLYKDVVLRGNFEKINDINNNLSLIDINGISLFLYNSFAGDIPVLVIPNKDDFNSIIQVLLYKNNPISLPSSMGASLINGINNWKKINNIKNKWLLQNSHFSWNEEFKTNVLPNKNLYKDGLIILSQKPYSGVSSTSVNIDQEKWLSISLKIRLEHECTHLYTMKRFGIASNNLHDELIADYVGIIKSVGFYNKDWMLAFMGLENSQDYRIGARLENYIKDIKIDSEDFLYLASIIRKAIENIYLFDMKIGKASSNEDLKTRIDTFCELDVLSMASENGHELLLKEYFKYNIVRN